MCDNKNELTETGRKNGQMETGQKAKERQDCGCEAGVVYHVSGTSGIRVLQPRVSTHNKAYVYAVEDLVTGLLFGARKDDFDFQICTDETGKTHVYECYPGGFRKVYEGRSCSVYELPAENFQRGKTSWTAELVSEQEVAVQSETVVTDLFQRLLEEEKAGSLFLHRYSDSPEYKKRIAEHVTDRLIRFGVLADDWVKDDRFAVYYRPLIEALLSVMDGHLLCDAAKESKTPQ